MSYYWIKLYHEILHDPKMGRLSDPLWRRTIELFLMAGETGKTGQLPPLPEMSWTCRITEERMLEDLQALSEFNIVHETEAGWFVTHFEQRQDADTDAERKQYQRKRERKVTHSPEPVTSRDNNVTRNVQELKLKLKIESEEEEGRSAPAAASSVPKTPNQVPANDQTIERLWQQATGMPTFMGNTRADDMRRIEAVYNRNEWDFQKTVTELKGYYEAWINTVSKKTNTKYSKQNTGWLDWAIAGEVNSIDNGHRKMTPLEKSMLELQKLSEQMT